MVEQISTNKRIAKNTFLLYFRMFLIIGVTFYTTRVILNVLGVENYGIYTTIGGIVLLFSFINNALLTTTQRYLNYYYGKNDITATGSHARQCIYDCMQKMLHFLRRRGHCMHMQLSFTCHTINLCDYILRMQYICHL